MLRPMATFEVSLRLTRRNRPKKTRLDTVAPTIPALSKRITEVVDGVGGRIAAGGRVYWVVA